MSSKSWSRFEDQEMSDDIYRSRCNNPQAAKEWRDSGLVRIDSLPIGSVFECIDGTFWQIQNRNRTGTIHCSAWGCDSEPTDFVQSALVLLLAHRPGT